MDTAAAMLKPPCGLCKVTGSDQTTALLSDVSPESRSELACFINRETSPDNVNMVSLGLSL